MSFASNLEKLHLWSNNLSGKIPDSISNVSKLTILELQGNSFFGLIPNTLGNLRFLEKLRLNSNHLTTKTSTHEWSFLYSLANCRHLRILDLSINPLNGLLPTAISNLSTSLQNLRVVDCKIKGSIPMEIDSLSNAISLDLSSNKLTGPIPTTMGRLKNLQLLNLYGNKLQGSVPPDLCGLKGLYKLSLGANELDGPLPTCLCELTSLRYLNLFSNKLHSQIPLSFWSLKDILEVDLSSNNLSGSLPLDIGNLKVLISLNLSRNLLSSDIPSTIGSFHDLQVLDLSRNRLQGPIPKSLGDLMSLKSLDLSNNNLSGVIPKSLEKLYDLNYFNVSFNRLEGEIPSGGPFSNFTAKSFIKNYALCGSPRLQVSPCKNKIHRNFKKTARHSLRYVLPTFVSTIIVVAFIVVYKKWQHGGINLAIVEDLIPPKNWVRISYNQLLEGTSGFSGSNLLGSGSFGSVYKGILSDGTDVAIKVFNLQIEGAFKSFDVECEVMSNILHRNLVKIITCCSTIDFKALVLEFMPNGSLEKWLYSYNYFLDILQRINIMIDVASALEYLHLGHPVPVIHCDLKPSNILLDKDMVAHVGDFGIAKLLGEGDSIKQTMTLATIGYMAPEYGSTGIISIKSDVYSYGILLIETFTRKKPTDDIFVGEMSMKHWVKRSLSEEIIGVIDSSLVQKTDEYFVTKANCISLIMRLALDCSAELPEDRLDMKNVVSMLKNIKREYLNNLEQD
ncbi:receptor kinase-like protein Xa21 [Durio zibethinus]|uniref:non-specific serine/threonine protein kinase n=1 Tax=Durio zibethinus TaxID=66656 RepID=A0A6P5Z674_DURZI|nr:receptor kinase-like protein Xa21 [Durio zibethinus]